MQKIEFKNNYKFNNQCIFINKRKNVIIKNSIFLYIFYNYNYVYFIFALNLLIFDYPEFT